MNTIGWLFILGGFLLIRQVSKGRVKNLGEDLSDAFIAAASADTKALSAVLARTGTSNDVIADLGTGTYAYKGKGNPANAADASTPQANAIILREAVNLGEAAKGYRFAASGPDYYDCSGLIWRACQKAGYTGGRFTTFTVKASKAFAQLGDPSLGVSQVTLGDIVLWPTHHMGVVSAPGRFYSARSVNSGIGESPIDNFSGYGKPIYLRYKGKLPA